MKESPNNNNCLILLQATDVLFLSYFHRGNFPSSLNQSYLQNCNFDPERAPFCPIFKVGDILKKLNQSLDTITDKVGQLSFAFHLFLFSIYQRDQFHLFDFCQFFTGKVDMPRLDPHGATQ